MKKIIAHLSVILIILLIGSIYYITEIQPFEYEGFENKINEFKKFNAELDKSIVQTQYGTMRNYDSIVNAVNGLGYVLNEFDKIQKLKPNNEIIKNLERLKQVTLQKESLTEKYKQYNPVLINAIYNFSTNLSQIIEDQSYDNLVESCLTLDYQFQAREKARNLFTGMLIYTNIDDELQRLKLIKLVNEIKKEPTDLPKLDLALIYADVILKTKPKINEINSAILSLPITQEINSLQSAFDNEYENYLNNANHYRIILYILVFILLVLLRWAFRRLERTIEKLNNEVTVRIKAENELEIINKELELRVQSRTKELQVKNKDLNVALSNLKDAQNQLVMKEKMASIGMLTTGIAHEIKNPLNFVNNFSDLSVELLKDLTLEIETFKKDQNEENASIISDIIKDLELNCKKINEHGQRADSIVKNMLQHSEVGDTQREKIEFNSLVSEYLKIACDAYKNKDKNLKVDVVKNFGDKVGKISVIPQTIGRVISYIIDNALYAISQKLINDPRLVPLITVETSREKEHIVLKIRDNGTGIPENKQLKIFEPFFTTKPTGTGTGLGLSICYDTIVKQHNGTLTVNSIEGEYSEFIITLPLTYKP